MLLGPMPTPAIAYLTRTLHADAGIVISASHNPFQDNGIKFFAGNGSKLPDEVELAIEAELERELEVVEPARMGKARRVGDAPGRSIEFCKGTVTAGLDLSGMRIVVDCAHGATYHVAPSVFTELGATVTTIGDEPDGFNINDGCGSTHPEALQREVLESGADLGIALDGDGDRVLMVDHKGELVDGDELLYVIALGRLQGQRLQGAVVGTVMSNLGLEHAVRAAGVEFHRAQVGDRYVLEMLRRNGWTLGGESSGHIICLDRTSTGDGIVSALQVIEAMLVEGTDLHTLKSRMTKYPQKMINVRMAQRVDLAGNAEVDAAVRQAERELGGRGRVLLRPSGTEPVVRVMVEGEDAAQVEALAARLADTVAEAVRRALAADA